LIRNIDTLRESTKKVKSRFPFHIDAWAVLPEHMHCIWTLPDGDYDFTTRWQLIKTHLVKALPNIEHRSQVAQKCDDRGI
jgi:putative transposase